MKCLAFLLVRQSGGFHRLADTSGSLTVFLWVCWGTLGLQLGDYGSKPIWHPSHSKWNWWWCLIQMGDWIGLERTGLQDSTDLPPSDTINTSQNLRQRSQLPTLSWLRAIYKFISQWLPKGYGVRVAQGKKYIKWEQESSSFLGKNLINMTH